MREGACEESGLPAESRVDGVGIDRVGWGWGHTDMHTYMHTYIHTCIHKHMHTHTCHPLPRAVLAWAAAVQRPAPPPRLGLRWCGANKCAPVSLNPRQPPAHSALYAASSCRASTLVPRCGTLPRATALFAGLFMENSTGKGKVGEKVQRNGKCGCGSRFQQPSLCIPSPSRLLVQQERCGERKQAA